LLALLLPASPVRASEFYYVIIFAAQRDALQPRYSHSFAAFARARGTGPCADYYCLDAFTISWLPQTLELHPFRLLPEPGVNLDLHRTLHWARENDMRV